MQSHGGMLPLEDGKDRPVIDDRLRPRRRHGRHAAARRRHRPARTSSPPTWAAPASTSGSSRTSSPRPPTRPCSASTRTRSRPSRCISIGAGGGSIAWIEPHSGTPARRPAERQLQPRARLLRPRRHRADGHRRRPGARLPRPGGGVRHRGRARDIHPRRDLAEQAIRRRSPSRSGSRSTDAALGIVEIVNAKMANVLERVVVGRGFDPRDFAIFAYGGSGPFHAAGYAGELGVDRGRHPRRGRLGLERLRHRALRHPLPARARHPAARRRSTPPSSRASTTSSRPPCASRSPPAGWRRRARSSCATRGSATSGSATSSRSAFPARSTPRPSRRSTRASSRCTSRATARRRCCPRRGSEIVSVRVQASSPTGVRSTSIARVQEGNADTARTGTRLVHFTRGEDARRHPDLRRHRARAPARSSPAPRSSTCRPPASSCRPERASSAGSGGDFTLTFGG